MAYTKGDLVEVISGKWKGRTGVIKRMGSAVFPDYCKIILDLKKRQRVQEEIFIEIKEIKLLQTNKITPMTETTTAPLLREIPLKDVVVSPTNPRKTFDQAKTAELAESIREKGVLQPILVRPKGNKFELVCGERRYRASKIVQGAIKSRDSVPAVIRDLSDQEVREIQLIENFQREDVHPMEEGVAIKCAVESGQYSFEELSHKVGKSLTYIKQRMKLNDLSLRFQELFFNGNLTLTTALKMSIFSVSVQDDILDDDGDYDDMKQNPNQKFEPNDYYLAKYRGKLSEASFDLTDATIDKKAGACSSCMYNSGYAQLFPEDANSSRCMNVTCFKNKTDIHFNRELEVAKEDPTIVFVSTQYNGFTNKKVPADLIAAGHEVFLREAYQLLEKPEQPDWEEYKNWNDYDDESSEEQEFIKKRFETEKSDYERDIAKYNDSIAAGKYKKAFVVDGDEVGAYIYIKLTGNKSKTPAASNKVDIKSDTLSAGDIDSEIARLKAKELRNKELDQNKVWGVIKPNFNPANHASVLNGTLSPVERKAIAMSISEKLHYSDSTAFDKLFKWKSGKNGFPEVEELTLWQMLRFFMLSVLPPAELTHGYDENIKAKTCIEIAEDYFPAELKEAMDAQTEVANKRASRVEKAIKDLQAKKKELAPAKPAPAKKPTKKAAPKKK